MRAYDVVSPWKDPVVKAENNPDYLRATAEAVAQFRQALQEFLGLHVINEWLARGLAPAVLRRDDADPHLVSQLRAKVARAAGRASAATSLTNSFVRVQGVGDVDPIAAWHTIAQPKPLLEADDVLGACDQMLGRLEAMRLKAEAEAPPTIGAEAMHPLIWGAARRLWGDQHYRAAVASASDTLVGSVKNLTRRNDVAETALWQETFSAQDPTPGGPRLRWPGDPRDRDVKTMNDGLRQLAPGVHMTIRNPATHSTDELGEQEALERLAVLSLLARWVDDCRLDEVEALEA